MPKSMQRQSLLGSQYFEHFNDAGKKLGESRERAGVFGKYTEHCDAAGKKLGESRERPGFFGRFVQHTDADGRKTGKSIERRSLLGDYTEHRDAGGHVVGKSKPRHSLKGLYLEHTGTGWFPTAVDTSGPGAVAEAVTIAERPLSDRPVPLKLRLALIAMLFGVGLVAAFRSSLFFR